MDFLLFELCFRSEPVDNPSGPLVFMQLFSMTTVNMLDHIAAFSFPNSTLLAGFLYTGSSRKSSKFAHGDSLSQTPEKKCTLTRRDGAAVKRLRRQLIPIPEDPIIPEIKEATPPTLGRFSHVSKDQVSISQTDSPKCLEQIFGSNTVNFGASNQGKREQSKQNNKSDQEPYFRRKEAAPSPSSSQIVSPILNRSWQLPSSPMLPATLSSPINASSSFYEHTSNASPLQKIISQSEEVIDFSSILGSPRVSIEGVGEEWHGLSPLLGQHPLHADVLNILKSPTTNLSPFSVSPFACISSSMKQFQLSPSINQHDKENTNPCISMQNGLNLSSPKATFSPLADLSWATTENIFGIIDLPPHENNHLLPLHCMPEPCNTPILQRLTVHKCTKDELQQKRSSASDHDGTRIFRFQSDHYFSSLCLVKMLTSVSTKKEGHRKVITIDLDDSYSEKLPSQYTGWHTVNKVTNRPRKTAEISVKVELAKSDVSLGRCRHSREKNSSRRRSNRLKKKTSLPKPTRYGYSVYS
eukprot:gene2465-5399_t